MKRFLAISCAALALSTTPLAVPASGADTSATPYPMEYWAVRDQLSNVALSPDGSQLAFMKITCRTCDPVIELRDVNNLGGKPHTIGGKSMEITGFDWVSDQDIVISFRDQVSKKIKGFNRGAYKSKIAHYNLRNKKFTALNKETSRSGRDEFELVEFINALPEEADKVLVRIADYTKGKAFGSPSYYKLDVSDYSKELVLKGSPKYQRIRFDHLGNPRIAQSGNSDSSSYFYRKVGDSSWTQFHTAQDSSFETFSYAGMVEGDPSRIYVIANNGNDRTGLWKFNLDTKSFEELVHRDSTVDIWGTTRHSNSWKYPGKVTGVSTYKDKFNYKFFDAEEERILNRFKASIKNAGLVRITDRSRDGRTMVVSNDSPRDPGSYYLYESDSQKFMKIGSARGILKGEALADVEYITYKARDGKTIPAFITKPNGVGPHPLVVMPHGGPFIREVVIYDEWAQMLANNGYMVLQPQYRGSKGYGIDFYKTSFATGGQGGRQMQDDKDDGVKHLISKGMVPKDKVGFFGWSYGGYAALIAAARPDNMYKCSIAGAAVADNFQQINYYRSFLSEDSVQGQEQLNMWTDSVNPIEEAANVNIPLFVIHGSIDQRVPPKHAAKYVAKLKKNGVPHKYLELKNADHFSSTLFYDHKMKMYPAIIDFLKNDCGM